MKKHKAIIIIFCLVFIFGVISTPSQAQTSLEFNQVLLVSNADTVPQGKVWKITGIVSNTGFSSSSQPLIYTLNINGQAGDVGHSGYRHHSGNGYYGYTSPMVDFSKNIWLPAGTTVAPGQYIKYISIIEFNVVP